MQSIYEHSAMRFDAYEPPRQEIVEFRLRNVVLTLSDGNPDNNDSMLEPIDTGTGHDW